MARWWRRREPAPTPEAEWQRISVEAQEARAHRLAALEGEEALVEELRSALFQADPIGLNFETNTDEYAAEAQTIAIGLPAINNLDELREMIHGVFVRWFDADLAGSSSRYTAVAQTTLAIGHRYHPLDVPRTIRVMPDYDCWPTWDDETGHNIDPRDPPDHEVTCPSAERVGHPL